MSKFSDEHIKYLKKKKMFTFYIIFFRIFILFLLFFLWYFGIKIKIINSFIYSSPSNVINTVSNLFSSGILIKHIFITIFEVVLCFFLSSFIGIIIATFFWKHDLIAKIFDPYLTILNSLPKVALGPLIIIWIGADIKSIIFMGFTVTIFTTIINIYTSFISTSNNYITMFKSFGASQNQIFKKLILPNSIKDIFSTLKINISLSLVGVIMGELLVSKNGLGYLIMYGSQIFNIDLVVSSIFILAIISYLMYYILELLNKSKKNVD